MLGAALAAVALAGLRGSFSLPLYTDDLVIVDHVRRQGPAALWSRDDLFAGYWRPWSRELHFWVLDRAGGGEAWPFRVVAGLLWAGTLVAYFALCRRVAGPAAAAVATCGLASLAAWGSLLVWASGSQDLWMLAAGVAFLTAFSYRRQGLAALALAVALFSKEPAAALPAVAAAYATFIDREPWRLVIRRVLPHGIIVLAWMLAHPLLLGRVWLAEAPVAIAHQPRSAPAVLASTLLALVNLDVPPAPQHGWLAALAISLPIACVLAAATWWIASRAERAPRGVRPARDERAGPASRWGMAWSLLAWGPLLTPWLGWHAYYTLLGAMGAWLVVGARLGRSAAWAALLVALVAVLRGPRADTRHDDLGSEAHLRAVGTLTRAARDGLLRKHPRLPGMTRVFLVDMPWGTSLVTGRLDSPALRVWYRDTSIVGGFLSDYRPREAADSGRDLILRWINGDWREIRRGAEDLTRAPREEPLWADSHYYLAGILYESEDFAGARTELEKLVQVHPERFGYAYNLAEACHALGDSAAVRHWVRIAAAAPDAPPEVRESAAR